MYSILNEIDKYIRENGIPFKEITISYDYFPRHFNQAILNIIRSISSNRYDFGAESYKLSYDKNGTLYLLCTDSVNDIKLCIANSVINNDRKFKMTLIPELYVLEDAAILKYYDSERLVIRNMIHNEYGMVSAKEKVKLENNIINTLAKNKLEQMISNKDNTIDLKDYNSEITKSIDNIISYIAYLNNYYKETLKQDKSGRYMEGIHFNNPSKDTIIRRNIGTSNKGSCERVNPVLSVDDRLSVLDSYKYIYKDFAYNENISDIEFLTYLYKSNDNYVLVIEPYNGMAPTKMIILDNREEITKDKFNALVKKYLELSYLETLKDDTVIRCYHTTLDAFYEKMEFVLNDKDNNLTNESFKNKVRKLKMC